MPQEHNVLRCFSCETFQVHIVKKAKKWECKICGEKQSLKRNYGKGSAKDCRNHVMKLNELRILKSNTAKDSPYSSFEDAKNSDLRKQHPSSASSNQQQLAERKTTSKWAQYVTEYKKEESETEYDSYYFENEIMHQKEQYEVKSKNKKRRICKDFNEISHKVDAESNDILTNWDSQHFDNKTEHKKPKNKALTNVVQNVSKSNHSKYSKYLDDDKSIDNSSEEFTKCSLTIFDSGSTDLDDTFTI